MVTEQPSDKHGPTPTVEGQNLKRLREDRNMTQVELGRAVNIEPTVICKLETGLRAMSADYALALSAYFGVPISLLHANRLRTRRARKGRR